MPQRTLYLIHGLPCCGKNTTARHLAGEQGVICETDQFFYTQVGDDPQRYDYDEALLPDVRMWNLARYRQALALDQTPIIVDRDSGLNAESREYALLANQHGYHIELREPESPWWQELRSCWNTASLSTRPYSTSGPSNYLQKAPAGTACRQPLSAAG